MECMHAFGHSRDIQGGPQPARGMCKKHLAFHRTLVRPRGQHPAAFTGLQYVSRLPELPRCERRVALFSSGLHLYCSSHHRMKLSSSMNPVWLGSRRESAEILARASRGRPSSRHSATNSAVSIRSMPKSTRRWKAVRGACSRASGALTVRSLVSRGTSSSAATRAGRETYHRHAAPAPMRRSPASSPRGSPRPAASEPRTR
mmetsp:Transcript_45332/g.118972  ORF Transcript_45332/g.118972 Transcript_45332/m.118972 type:complete len:202 (-) Transcript_45332:503-1108(-)